MRNFTIYTLFFFLGLNMSFAQEKKIAKANEEFNNYNFIDAREAYLKVAEDGYRDANMLKKLGDSYYFTADYSNAAQWYGALYEMSDSLEAEYLYRYALALKSNKQYDASDTIMEEFLDAKGADYRAGLYKEDRNYLAEIEELSGRFELSNVGFNSKLSDFAPMFYQGQLIIASNRLRGNVSSNIHDWNDQPFLDLYNVSKEGDKASKFDKGVNTKYHESTASATKDGNTIYFTRNNYTNKDYKDDSSGVNRLKLYRGKRVDGKWEVVELPFNSDEYSVAHPALSPDEKTLYFASDKPGGKGMSDLYKVSIEGDGFGTPVSLGDGINTEGRETFPFVSSKGKFYFASDGHVGLGGLDVFVSEVDDLSNAYNVGRPINGPQDDFTFIINAKTGLGYFASNREGGVGDDDVYGFNRVKEFNPKTLTANCTSRVEGTVLDRETNEAIGGAKVMLLNDAGDVLEQSISDTNGSFSFVTECSTQYAVRSSKEDYTTAEKPFATSNESATVKKTLYMSTGADLGTPIKAGVGSDLGLLLGLQPIYFDLDKSNIRYDAEIELRKVIAVMKAYPAMKIDVRSHTDSRAKDDYNMALSNRRAASTVDYIVSQGGIDRARLTSQGYGETQLTNGCVNGAACSEGAHQMNRRSEFIIMEQ